MKQNDQIREAKELVNAMQSLRMDMRNYIRKKIKESELDLTYEMLQVLVVLWKNGDINQQEIADTISKNKASLTSLLDNLTKSELIVRSEDPADRRSKIISLTKMGHDYKEELDALLNGFYESSKAGLSKTEIEHASAVLTKMRENLWK